MSLSSFIWSVADLLRGDYKQSEYGKVILPFTVLRRMDCVLAETKKAVLVELSARRRAGVNPEPFLLRKAKQSFYNTSPMDMKTLMGDQDHIKENLYSYIQAFSPSVRDIFERFDFFTQIDRLAKCGLLYQVAEKFTGIDLHPETVTNTEMGTVFEELIRKFAEISNETAGEHFTPREVIRLMVNLLFVEDDDVLAKPGVVRTIYDPAAGTGGMLSVAGEYLAEHNPQARLTMYGQELNDESYAICKADMLIKGQDVRNIVSGNTLSDDGHAHRKFDYMLSNPPFGVEWKKVEKAVRQEYETQGYNGRFGPGLPRVSDGSLLFLLHLISKMRPAVDGGSRFGIVLNGSSMDVHPNAIILGFNVGIGLFVALGAGLWPALRAARAHPAWDLKAGDRSVAARQLGGWVVILQVAVSASLVAAAVLLGGTLGRLLTEDSGFDTEGTALASIHLNPSSSEGSERTVGALLRGVRNKPGVLAAGFSGTEPLSGFFGASREFGVDSHGNVHSDANVLDRWVSPGYFSAAGTRLLRGESSAPVAAGAMAQCVLSDNFAATVFPGESPIGRIVYAARAGQPDGANLDPKAGCLVVGVVENARLVSLRAEAPHLVYNVISPWVESEENRSLFSHLGVNLVVRAKNSSLALAALQDAVKETIPGVEEVRYRTFRQLEDSDLNRERMLVSVSGSLAMLALLLTALGLYGLLMRSVVLRTREIGIRVALGAQKSKVVIAVARKSMLDIGAGLLAGEAAAFFLTKGIRQLLETPQPTTMTPYLWSSGILLLVGAIAIFLPARRIVSVDPMQALRTE